LSCSPFFVSWGLFNSAHPLVSLFDNLPLQSLQEDAHSNLSLWLGLLARKGPKFHDSLSKVGGLKIEFSEPIATLYAGYGVTYLEASAWALNCRCAFIPAENVWSMGELDRMQVFLQSRFTFLFISCSAVSLSATSVFPSLSFDSAQAQPAPTALKKSQLARLADRVSLVLTGDMASAEDKAEVVKGTLSLENLAEKLKTNPKTEEQLAKFWLEKLKISSAVPIGTISKTDNSIQNSISTIAAGSFANGPNTNIIQWSAVAGDAGSFAFKRIPPGQNVFPQSHYESQRTDCQARETVSLREACVNAVNARENNQKVYTSFLSEANCSNTQARAIRPWWNKTVSVKACPDAVLFCGSDLSKCFVRDSRLAPGHSRSNDDKIFPYYSNVIRGFTEEPGRLIAKVILDDRPWSQTLLSTESPTSGAMQHFLTGIGSLIVQNGPPASYTDRQGNSTLSSDFPENTDFKWIERGPEHSGILTTPAYHLVTNGYRAKVNRSYESFLCKTFFIAPGTPIDESSESDLTKRAPCSDCHRVIEPLGRYFFRFPQTGTNFRYDAAVPAKPSATPYAPWAVPNLLSNTDFGNFEGADVRGFGAALSVNPEFKTCAVLRAWEFVMGKAPATTELAVWQGRLLDTYNTSGGKIWPVIKQIIGSPDFIGGIK
jgi:hypothetical protein